jgi:hypothetical protein
MDAIATDIIKASLVVASSEGDDAPAVAVGTGAEGIDIYVEIADML